MERLVQFELFGQDFSFYTDASEEDVVRIIDLVREELGADQSKKTAQIPSSKMLILGCLKIAAKCVQVEKDFETFRAQQDESITRLIGKYSSEMK